MKNYVVRSLQVSMLEKSQLESLHRIESLRGYLLPNWNIQELFSTPTIKEMYQLPEKEEVFNIHGLRIENELKTKGFLNVDTSDASQDNTDVLWMHSFDWNVLNNKSRIVWDFSSYGRGKLTDQIKSRADIYG